MCIINLGDAIYIYILDNFCKVTFETRFKYAFWVIVYHFKF